MYMEALSQGFHFLSLFGHKLLSDWEICVCLVMSRSTKLFVGLLFARTLHPSPGAVYMN